WHGRPAHAEGSNTRSTCLHKGDARATSNPQQRSGMIPAACRRARWPLAGLVSVALFVALVARFWHPVFGFTVFFQLDAWSSEHAISAFRDLPVYVHPEAGGYDGLFYAQIAHDPTLRDSELSGAVDDLPYRARRI